MPTPLKAIRSHCLWCCNSSANEVSLCTAKVCPLHPYRFGHRPVRPWSRGPMPARRDAGDAKSED
jgi:hypothetical protein